MAVVLMDEKEEEAMRLMKEIFSQHGLTMEACERKISKSHIQIISECYCEKWRLLPCHLDMPDIVVKDIERNKQNENERRHLFFSRWEKEKGSEATYKKLIYSLLLINSRDDAEEICKMICSQPTKETSTGISSFTATTDHLNLRIVCNELSEVKTKSYEISIQLGIPHSNIKMFEKESDPLSAAIDYWLCGNVSDVPITWESIVQALQSRHVGENGVAERIAHKYCHQSSLVKDFASLSISSFPSYEKLTSSVYIKGISTVQKIEVCLTNEEQLFEWKGYGLKLTIPPHSLPKNVDSCTITIQASLSGNYEFPANAELVSPVFWLKCQPACKFVTPLGLEISHCAPLENSSRLSMVRAFCTQTELPYNFKPLPGGSFSPKYSYGFINLEGFSGLAVVQNGSYERRYWSSVFYMGPTKRRKVHFAVTWDDDAHITTIKNEYEARSAQNGPEQSLMFERDIITLDIPRKGHVMGDWKVTPTVAPKISKKDVDSHHLESKSKAVPHCELVARWMKREQEIEALEYLVDIHGATDNKFFTIIIDSSDDQQDVVTSPSLRLPPTVTSTVVTSGDVSYLMGHLCDHASKWTGIGTSLTFLPGELENIIHTHPSASPQRLLTKLLSQWSQWPTAKHPDHPTVERLCEALRSGLVGLGAVAQNLYEQRNSLPSIQVGHS